jgi:hypothetical protein
MKDGYGTCYTTKWSYRGIYKDGMKNGQGVYRNINGIELFISIYLSTTNSITTIIKVLYMKDIMLMIGKMVKDPTHMLMVIYLLVLWLMINYMV